MANNTLTYEQELELLDASEEKAIPSRQGLTNIQELELLDIATADYKAQEKAQRAEEEHGVVGEFVAGLGRGALRVAATPFELADIAGEAIGFEGLERVGEAGARGIEEYIEESPRLRRSESISKNILNAPELWTDPRFYASLVGEGLPTILSMLVPGMAAGKVAKVAGLTKKGIRAAQIAGGLGAATTLEAGGAAENIRQYEKRTGESVPIGTKLQAVIGTGVVAGALEFVPIFAIFGKAGGSKLVSRVIRGMIAEGSTEGAQELVANAFAQAGYDPDQRMVDGVVESIVGGVLLGGGMGTISKATSEATNFIQKIEEVDPNEVVDILEKAEEERSEFEELEEYEKELEAYSEEIRDVSRHHPMSTISEETDRVARHYMKDERIEKRLEGLEKGKVAGPGIILGQEAKETPELLTAEGIPVEVQAVLDKPPQLWSFEDRGLLEEYGRDKGIIEPAPIPIISAFGMRAKTKVVDKDYKKRLAEVIRADRDLLEPEGAALTPEELIQKRADVLAGFPRKPADISAEVFEKELGPVKEAIKPKEAAPGKPTKEIEAEPIPEVGEKPKKAKEPWEKTAKKEEQLKPAEVAKRYPLIPSEVIEQLGTIAFDKKYAGEGKFVPGEGLSVKANTEQALLHEIAHGVDNILTKEQSARWEEISAKEIDRGLWDSKPVGSGKDPYHVYENLYTAFALFHKKASGFSLTQNEVKAIESHPEAIKFIQENLAKKPTPPPKKTDVALAGEGVAEAKEVKPVKEIKPKLKEDFGDLTGIKVTITAIREETGEKVTFKEDAQVALDEVGKQKSTYEQMLECLAA